MPHPLVRGTEHFTILLANLVTIVTLLGLGDEPLPVAKKGFRTIVLIGHDIYGDLHALLKSSFDVASRVPELRMIIDTQRMAYDMGLGRDFSLSNLYAFLFGEAYKDPHNSGNDAWATARVFLGLARRLVEHNGLARRFPVADVLFKVFDAEWKEIVSGPNDKTPTEYGFTTFDSRIFSKRPVHNWIMVDLLSARHFLIKEFEHYFNKNFGKGRSYPRRFAYGTQDILPADELVAWLLHLLVVHDDSPNDTPRLPTGLPASSSPPLVPIIDRLPMRKRATEKMIAFWDDMFDTGLPAEASAVDPVQEMIDFWDDLDWDFYRAPPLDWPPSVDIEPEVVSEESRYWELMIQTECPFNHKTRWERVGSLPPHQCDHYLIGYCKSADACADVLICTGCRDLQLCRRCQQAGLTQHGKRTDHKRKMKGLEGYKRRGEMDKYEAAKKKYEAELGLR